MASAQELSELIRRFNGILREIRSWPDDEEHRRLVGELREVQARLDEELPPVTEPRSD